MADWTLQQLLSPWCDLDSQVAVTDLSLDSRQAGPGCLFVAIPGHQVDGRDFIDQALERGASAVLAEGEEAGLSLRGGKPLVTLPDLRRRLSAIAWRFFGEPAILPVGITGTNGKTTTSQLLAQLCDKLDRPAGIVGTLGAGRFNALEPALNTTPDAIGVARTLAGLAAQGCQVAAMEVSSHALMQGRVSAVPYKVAVFTNLSRDHLDYHGTLGAYAAAKAQLFDWPTLDASVINADDPLGEAWLRERKGRQHCIAFGLSPLDPDIADQVLFVTDVRPHLGGVRARVLGSFGEAELASPLLGLFNLSNLLAAIAAGLALGLPLDELCAAATFVKAVTGRMQTIEKPGKPLVVVDYAHTPDALEVALKALRFHTKGKLWCVFGCGGDRDPGKRPLMTQAVARGADIGVLTADNPRSEDPMAIIQQMLAGGHYGDAMQVVADRRDAIRHAISMAAPGDLVLVAGKGHEDYQEIRGRRLPFSDIEEVQRVLDEEASC
ncbi:UDP-N-acetylmuramoyl-L-alanyl-D-glutamate--2,6-diaminopimelate ligase [Gallaecimonas kandeliae]|uniref:UDP-N-acetylmuramoyl-L-alanyl-D-glutamate--2, 6-diaminopimelate ligase n=1 Tax=Gallaecimonas kandeliae TaxID=3029055 RepID=UPI0026470CE7|nr:UDP-N-acetylmuramoyl-L-alanyl-D-glutamate--2,6-diaminopimelate ligase [Gallaecimonas kandeliae]WKE66080.1 UDP-N-acetylmuramoyl-L-alanyl-D-glutamate--2,6-diaminopimelate ligase [Gallaecimonas kandeliae]